VKVKMLNRLVLAVLPMCVALLACGSEGNKSSAAAAASSRPRYDFRGIHLGDSISPAIAAAQRFKCDSVGCSTTDSLAGVEAFVFLEKFDGRLMSVVVTYPTAGFSTIQQLSKGKWGEPTRSALDTMTTRMGAKFPVRRLSWDMLDGTLHVDEMGDRVTEGVMIITYDSLTKLRDARDSLRIQQAAKKVI
jgi:hypothetical protein